MIPFVLLITKTPPSVISYQLHKEQIFRQQIGNTPVSRYSVYNKQKKHGWVIEKKYVVCKLDGLAACI